MAYATGSGPQAAVEGLPVGTITGGAFWMRWSANTSARRTRSAAEPWDARTAVGAIGNAPGIDGAIGYREVDEAPLL